MQETPDFVSGVSGTLKVGNPAIRRWIYCIFSMLSVVDPWSVLIFPFLAGGKIRSPTLTVFVPILYNFSLVYTFLLKRIVLIYVINSSSIYILIFINISLLQMINLNFLLLSCEENRVIRLDSLVCQNFEALKFLSGRHVHLAHLWAGTFQRIGFYQRNIS